jgi:hypothetical protein
MSQLYRLKDLLPDYYDRVFEMQQLMAAEQPVIDDFQFIVDQAVQNEFIVTADSKGLSIFETMYGIQPAAGASIEMRRFHLLTFLALNRPYTFNYLREVLKSLDPESSAELINDLYQLKIDTYLERAGETAELDNFLQQVLPANLDRVANNHVDGNTSGHTYLASGIVPTEVVVITQDYREIAAVAVDANISAGAIPTVMQTIVHDYRETNTINDVPVIKQNQVETEIIEIH